MQGRLRQAQADNMHAGGWTALCQPLGSAAITVKGRHRAAILGNSKNQLSSNGRLMAARHSLDMHSAVCRIRSNQIVQQ